MCELSDIVLLPSDFPALAQACADDPEFPEDFDRWSDLLERSQLEARDRGLFYPPLWLDPIAFVT